MKQQPISYPNRIQDKHTLDKMREVIDHANALKVAHDQTAAATAENTALIKALPSSFITTNDVNSQIYYGLRSTGAITSYVVQLLKASGVTVPAQLPPFIPPGNFIPPGG